MRKDYRLMPYGVWGLADGTEILFDRRYNKGKRIFRPFLCKTLDGVVSEIEYQQFDFVDQLWFYRDGNIPRCCIATRKRLQKIEARWRTEPDFRAATMGIRKADPAVWPNP